MSQEQMDTLPETTGNQTVAQENTAVLNTPPIAPQNQEQAPLVNENQFEADEASQSLNNSKLITV